jgi:GMP synthase PP-ATPase subunit
VIGEVTPERIETVRKATRIVEEVPGVVSVTYYVTAKPPSCIKAV